MSKHKARVTYHFKDTKGFDTLESVECEVTRAWNGVGYESMVSLAKRCTPGKDAEWMTISRTDLDRESAVTFRVADLESIDYDEIED